MRLAFEIPGRPVPKGRPRVVRTRTGRARTFTPERTRKYELHCGRMAWQARQRYEWGPTLDGKSGHTPDRWPVDARFSVVLRVYGARANADMDNVAKSVLDGCEGEYLLWRNDKQVTRTTVERCEGKPARVEVVVEVIP